MRRESQVTSLLVHLTTETPADPALLGGKGAGLVELISLGLPVPPAFVLTTDACRKFAEAGTLPADVRAALPTALAEIGRQAGRRFGDPADPLLVSVRSGAPISMPGMMDTILNVGLTRATLTGLGERVGQTRAHDCYARLLEMYAASVHEASSETVREGEHASLDNLLRTYEQATGSAFPDTPEEQLERAIAAVFRSWNSQRATAYRRFKKMPDTGTAVVVQAMVLGNAAEPSGTGVLFTRDPSTGEDRPFGDYLAGAQGEEVVAGTRNADDLSELERLAPTAYDDLVRAGRSIERRFRDVCEVEFTLERGRLWILQARIAHRSDRASIRIATALADEGAIEWDEALTRVEPSAVESELLPRLDRSAVPPDAILDRGIAAAPGVVSGAAVFTSAQAVARSAAGERVILVRPETRPDDIEGIVAAHGLLTTRGGKTSHAAVVARGLGRCCVCGAESIEIDETAGCLRVAGAVVAEGEIISLDGEFGWVIRGPAPLVEAEPQPALARLLDKADRRRKLRLHARVTDAVDVSAAIAARPDGLLVETGEPARLAAIAASAEPLPVALAPVATDGANGLPSGVLALGSHEIAYRDDYDSGPPNAGGAWAVVRSVDTDALRTLRDKGVTEVAVPPSKLAAARLIAAQLELDAHTKAASAVQD